ncbi:hypothetical protein [Actinomadura flavalba]|uniref:hypothetical protein n=1 Tax=Actinomadura flavalba TaxID=1120938 RepID=UPI00037781FB|nr:hypothetical protein [Actinomadura flavalba]
MSGRTIPDAITHRGETGAIAGVHGTGLFGPAALGIGAAPIDGGRGHAASYLVDGDRLLLTGAVLGPTGPGGPPTLFGAGPDTSAVPPAGAAWVYTGLRVPVPFSGGLLAGADPVGHRFGDRVFHPHWTYGRLTELLFEDGRLVRADDRSGEDVRAHGAGLLADEDAPAPWIERRFALTYEPC